LVHQVVEEHMPAQHPAKGALALVATVVHCCSLQE